MRLGLSLPAYEGTAAEIPQLVGRAEELGYTDVWSYEHSFYDAFSPLAMAAVASRDLRLGTAIVPVFTRPAPLIAMQAAALAAAAPGRFVLGLGSSTQVIVEQWMGIPFEKPWSRTVAVAREVKQLLAGERVGRFRLGLPPAEPPPWLAALGPKMLASAGEDFDGVCFFLTGPKIIPELLRGAGRPIDSVARLNVFPGRFQAVAPLARYFTVPYALAPFYAAVMERQGFDEEVRAIQTKWAAGDRAEAPGMVSDAMLEELLLVGDSDQIRERLAAYDAAGLGCAAINVVSGLAELMEDLAPGR